MRRGPCYHCGINSTPLWRQGPADKPVLCNACGSRYRYWGSLENYFPRQSLPEPEELLDNSPTEVLDSENGMCEKSSDSCNSEIPPKSRSSRIVPKKMTPMQTFHAQLLNELKNQEIKDEVLLFDNVNNFIPPNEIGLGAVLLKPDGTSK
ncbi:GATA transcription factor [Trifolium repens]|nr:GATA transcription factor [Trifolium repens]